MRAVSNRIAIAFGFIASLLFYSRLPGPYLTGPFLRIGSFALAPRPLIAFVLPSAALITSIVLRQVWKNDYNDTCRSISLVVVLFINALHVLLLIGLSTAPAIRPWLGRAAVMLLGSLLIACGNQLPRTRPNLAFGIRTRRTLSDRNMWIQINRVGGYVAVVLGVTIVIAGALLTKPAMPAVVNIVAIGGLIVLIVSYRKHAGV